MRLGLIGCGRSHDASYPRQGVYRAQGLGCDRCRKHGRDHQPYIWHVNEGEEVFAVLDGIVDMHYREDGAEKIVTLETGDIFFAGIGCEHVAHPRGEARILVVEQEGSV